LAVEKEMKSKMKDIETEDFKLRNEKKDTQALNDELVGG
jgi:hypothetical protein